MFKKLGTIPFNKNYKLFKIIQENMETDDIQRIDYKISGRKLPTLTKGNKKMEKMALKGMNVTGILAYSFSLPAMITCPGAGICAGRDESGKPFCYALYGNSIYISTKYKAWQLLYSFLYNFEEKGEKLKNGIIKDIIRYSKKAQKENKILFVRIHDSGDFFDKKYVEMWLDIIDQFPLHPNENQPFSPGDVLFLAYSKSLELLRTTIKHKRQNFFVIDSTGSSDDLQNIINFIKSGINKDQTYSIDRIMTAIGPEQVAQLKQAILKINPNAEVIVANNEDTDLNAIEAKLSNPNAYIIAQLRAHGSGQKNVPQGFAQLMHVYNHFNKGDKPIGSIDPNLKEMIIKNKKLIQENKIQKSNKKIMIYI